MGEAYSLATWCPPDSSELVTEGRNTAMKIGDHERSKSRTLKFPNTQTIVLVAAYNVCTCQNMFSWSKKKSVMDSAIFFFSTILADMECTAAAT